MKQILLAYDPHTNTHQETVTAVVMFYKNTKATAHSPDGDTNIFEIITGIMQGDTLALYLFEICVDYLQNL